MVFDVSTLNMSVLSIQPFKDRNDYKNYEPANWTNGYGGKGTIYIPSGRTTAVNNSSFENNNYAYWNGGGFSWAIPYVVGVISLGLQVDPTLTKENAIRYLYTSAYPYKDGGIINPEGFIQLVEANRERRYASNSDYYFVLYNSKNVNTADHEAINLYVNALKGSCNVLLKDTSLYSDAAGVYQAIRTAASRQKGKLKGVQIIGTSEDVPAFDIKFKIQMAQGIDESGSYKSDFFYSTFRNDVTILKNDLSIFKVFQENLKVNFSSEWPVSRLPLEKGEIAGFIKRYGEYAAKAADHTTIPLVNFSSPIFATMNHSDDMGYFIRERLDKEFHFLKSNQYRLYGNQQGYYPVTNKVVGDFSKENLKAENKKGIMDLFINSHGQADNIDQVLFETAEATSEKRISLVNKTDMNQVLSENYYTLTTWTCSNAWNLAADNLLHEAMANGKCVNALGATAVLSNNGVNNSVTLDQMKKNNFYYFQYEFFKNLSQGKSRSQSFQLAQKAYAESILKNTSMLYEGNYQFNLNNVLVYHHLGLLECSPQSIRALNAALKYPQNEPAQSIQTSSSTQTSQPGSSGQSDQSNQSQSTTANSSKDNPNDFNNVSFEVSVAYTHFMHKPDCTVTSLKAGKMGESIVFSIDYESDEKRSYSFFEPPSGSILQISDSEGLPAGKHNKKFQVNADELSKTSAITMKIYRPNTNDDYCINFATAQLVSLMNQDQKNNLFGLSSEAPSEENKYTEFDNVGFDVSISYDSSFESHDCRVTSLKAGKMDYYIVFSMDYEGDIQRGYSIFNPPSGSIFMVFDKEGLPAGKHTVKFKVEAAKLRTADYITIKLYSNVGESNYLFFKPSQLSSLLN